MLAFSPDLRRPLANIKGFSGEINHALKELRKIMNDHMSNIDESVKTRLEDILDKDIPESLGFIDSSARKMGKLINSVLNPILSDTWNSSWIRLISNLSHNLF